MRSDSFLRDLRSALTPPDATARTVWALAAAIVVARSLVFAVAPQAFFDSDQAVFGLMAKHLSEGRALPVFMYGQNYILAVEAWMAAPLFLVGGPSVALLKLPLVAIGVVTALLLMGLLNRDAGLTPWTAFVASLFFILPPPGTAAQLVEASGGNLEPFLYVLLLWIARRHGVAFGAILAFGFLHREFTVYGALAIAIVGAWNGRGLARARARMAGRAAAAFAVVWIVISLVKLQGSAAGPGTSIGDLTAPRTNLGELVARFCGDVRAVVGSGSIVYHEYLAYLFGLRVQRVTDFAVNSSVTQGMGGLDVLMAVLVGACAIAIVRRRRPREREGNVRVVQYLAVVGLAAIVFYTWGRCGELSIFTLRYGLLALFAMIALAASALDARAPRGLRQLIVTLIAIWALASAMAHAKIVVEYIRRPPPQWRGIIANYLVERGVRYAESDYWTAYHVTFLSGERVIVGTRDLVRIATYQRLLDAHRGEVWSITRERCTTGLQVIPGWYVCPP